MHSVLAGDNCYMGGQRKVGGAGWDKEVIQL